MALAAVGIAVSVYLSILHFALLEDSGRVLCTVGSILSCDRILRSSYSTLGGIPVAVLGIVGFAWLLGLGVWRFVDERPATQWIVSALFFGTALAMGLDAALTLVASMTIRAACPGCLVISAVTAGLFCLSWRLRVVAVAQPGASRKDDCEARWRVLVVMGVGGATLILLLIAIARLQIQWAGRPGDDVLQPLAVGQTAPTFVARDLNGHVHRLEDYRSTKPVVLEFVWTFCRHCRAIAPAMRDAAAMYGSRVAIFSVAGDPRDREHLVRAFAQEYEHAWPYLLVDQELLAAYGVTGYPTIVVVGRDGRIQEMIRGEVSLETLKAALERALRTATRQERFGP